MNDRTREQPDKEDGFFPVREWHKESFRSLEREVEERELNINISGYAIAQALYKEDSEDAQTKVKMMYTGWAKKGESRPVFQFSFLFISDSICRCVEEVLIRSV